MPGEYSKEELWKLYEKLPKELQEAIFSVEVAKNIRETCKRNEVEDKMSEIAAKVGHVLLGVLSPDDFREYLEQELGKDKAKGVFHDINRFVFFPVKGALAQLYEMYEIKVAPPRPAEKKEDVYREPID